MYRRLDCLLNRLLRCRSKETSKLRVTGLCKGNSPVTGEFPSQRASNVSIWWCHHVNVVLGIEVISLSGIMNVNNMTSGEHIVKYSWKFSCMETVMNSCRTQWFILFGFSIPMSLTGGTICILLEGEWHMSLTGFICNKNKRFLWEHIQGPTLHYSI